MGILFYVKNISIQIDIALETYILGFLLRGEGGLTFFNHKNLFSKILLFYKYLNNIGFMNILFSLLTAYYM